MRYQRLPSGKSVVRNVKTRIGVLTEIHFLGNHKTTDSSLVSSRDIVMTIVVGAHQGNKKSVPARMVQARICNYVVELLGSIARDVATANFFKI